MDAALRHRLGARRRRDLVGRLHRDAFEREIGLEHARQRRGLVDADLRAGERMIARLEDQPLVGPHRLVARIALDLDEADHDVLARRGRRGSRCCSLRWGGLLWRRLRLRRRSDACQHQREQQRCDALQRTGCRTSPRMRGEVGALCAPGEGAVRESSFERSGVGKRPLAPTLSPHAGRGSRGAVLT